MISTARLWVTNPEQLARLISFRPRQSATACKEPGRSGTSTARTSSRETIRPLACKLSTARSGWSTRNFMTPKLPLLAIVTQQMLTPAWARIWVIRAVWPGLFSTNTATRFMGFISVNWEAGRGYELERAFVQDSFGFAFRDGQGAGGYQVHFGAHPKLG